MSTSRENQATLYTPIYDVYLLQDFKEEAQINQKVFTMTEDKTKEFKVNGMSALGVWEDANELEGGQYEDPVSGYPKTYTPTKKRKRLEVSFEAVDQDEYAILSREKDARALGRGGRARIEQDTSGVLYNGFTTAGADGDYLWGDSHPKNSEETGTTYDNLLSGAFSHDNLEAAESQISQYFKDPKGIPIAIMENALLLYPPALRGAVQRVLSDRALERPGTANRDINIYAGKYTPIEWRFLAADMGGSDTAWYIIFPEMGMLRVVWQVRPHFTSWVDYDLEAYVFSGRMLYAVGADDWRCGFASTGT